MELHSSINNNIQNNSSNTRDKYTEEELFEIENNNKEQFVKVDNESTSSEPGEIKEKLNKHIEKEKENKYMASDNEKKEELDLKSKETREDNKEHINVHSANIEEERLKKLQKNSMASKKEEVEKEKKKKVEMKVEMKEEDKGVEGEEGDGDKILLEDTVNEQTKENIKEENVEEIQTSCMINKKEGEKKKEDVRNEEIKIVKGEGEEDVNIFLEENDKEKTNILKTNEKINYTNKYHPNNEKQKRELYSITEHGENNDNEEKHDKNKNKYSNNSKSDTNNSSKLNNNTKIIKSIYEKEIDNFLIQNENLKSLDERLDDFNYFITERELLLDEKIENIKSCELKSKIEGYFINLNMVNDLTEEFEESVKEAYMQCEQAKIEFIRLRSDFNRKFQVLINTREVLTIDQRKVIEKKYSIYRNTRKLISKKNIILNIINTKIDLTNKYILEAKAAVEEYRNINKEIYPGSQEDVKLRLKVLNEELAKLLRDEITAKEEYNIMQIGVVKCWNVIHGSNIFLEFVTEYEKLLMNLDKEVFEKMNIVNASIEVLEYIKTSGSNPNSPLAVAKFYFYQSKVQLEKMHEGKDIVEANDQLLRLEEIRSGIISDIEIGDGKWETKC